MVDGDNSHLWLAVLFLYITSGIYRCAVLIFLVFLNIFGLLFSKSLFLRSLRIDSRIPGLLVCVFVYIYIYIYIYIYTHTHTHIHTHIFLCPFDSILGYGFLLWGFAITFIGHPTLVRIPLDEWSTRRRDLYLATHNIHKRHASMIPVGCEPEFPASKRPYTHALERAATGIGSFLYTVPKFRDLKLLAVSRLL